MGRMDANLGGLGFLTAEGAKMGANFLRGRGGEEGNWMELGWRVFLEPLMDANGTLILGIWKARLTATDSVFRESRGCL